MNPALLAFLSQFDTLTSKEITEIGALIPVREAKKETVLVRQGEICDECFFVLKGCLRQYTLVDGVEKTTQFYTEEEAAVFFTSYATQSPSDSYLSCVEDSVLIVGKMDAEAHMYEQFPKLEQITRKMMEQDFGKIQDLLNRFITSTPEERYQDLLRHRPSLLQRVPQHQIASYIGVTPESLSRIRKRLFEKGE